MIQGDPHGIFGIPGDFNKATCEVSNIYDVSTWQDNDS